ncbi:MAG: ABC transporter permease [Candidatus Dormibacteria bacterium]
MARYVARQFISSMPVLLVVIVTVFLLIHLTPGDPAAVMLGSMATPDQVAVLRHDLGFDQPLIVQFLRWVGELLHGNLGRSIYFHESVVHTLYEHAGPTMSLTLLALSIALILAIPSGICAAWFRGSLLDPAFMSASLLGTSIPNFWLALVLILLFAVKLGWLPVAGYSPLADGAGPWFSHILLPAFVLAVQQAGIIARMLRDGMIEVLHQPFIVTARSKGLAQRVVLGRHALPNAAIPTATVIGTSLTALLGGAVVTETVFNIPGIGQLVVDSIARRDYPIVQGVVLFVAVVYVFVNIGVDVVYAAIDPRIRYA